MMNDEPETLIPNEDHKLQSEQQGAEQGEIEETDFDFTGFQVVRREFFAHLQEPSIVFNQGKVGVNTACVRKLPETDFIQILVNREKKMLVVRPCQEADIHSFLWSTSKANKKYPRQVTGRLFFMKICNLMNWNPDYRYKIMGKMVYSQGQYLFVFDLSATEVYRRTQADGEKPKTSRSPVFPIEWKDQFGIPYEDRQKALQINMFEGYAVYAIRGEPDNSAEKPMLPAGNGEHPATPDEEGPRV